MLQEGVHMSGMLMLQTVLLISCSKLSLPQNRRFGMWL